MDVASPSRVESLEVVLGDTFGAHTGDGASNVGITKAVIYKTQPQTFWKITNISCTTIFRKINLF